MGAVPKSWPWAIVSVSRTTGNGHFQEEQYRLNYVLVLEGRENSKHSGAEKSRNVSRGSLRTESDRAQLESLTDWLRPFSCLGILEDLETIKGMGMVWV